MNRPAGIRERKQLLVEGNDERNFFEALLGHIGVGGIQIQNFGGVASLKGFLRVFVKLPGFQTVTSVGIVRDADRSEASALQSVQSSLRNAALPVPTRCQKPASGAPTTCVMILPGNKKPGALENLLCQTISDASMNQCIGDFLVCAQRVPGTTISNQGKAHAFAYLATQKNAHHSVGVAAKNGIWDLNHAVLGDVRSFLTGL